ncbi:replication restart DNA helicase PriA [Salinibacillus kushneri]|uniref:Replication restart protein PriA n=1 Tax=Salinibacillus kushneri TaxID=237682 RepID=A0A1I0HKB5_9BACI|nr:primosomal protein N' [Salinibacillus kushneri]SET84365.1 replication restart DNA helicase PriA [Salinibacillus kushneri]
MTIASVIVDVPSMAIDHVFDYRVPERYEDSLEEGMRVIIPFGPRKVMGFVVKIKPDTDVVQLKEIHEVMDYTPVLTKELLELGTWIANKTLSFQITSLQVMLPQVLKAKYKKELWLLAEEIELTEALQTLFAGRVVVSFEEIEERNIPYSQIQKAIKDGNVEVRYIVKSKETKKKITWAQPIDVLQLEEALIDIPKQAKKQKAIVEFFLHNPEPVPMKKLMERLNTTRSTVKSLTERGLIEVFEKEVYRDPYENRDFERTEPLPLTEEQSEAITPIHRSIKESAHEVFLLHGVTGSGKTEVYLQSIQKALDKGEEAIVLVPEISLTPQMVQRFKGRFGSEVAVMHSGLSAGEKFDEWRKILRKEVRVVVGARSAIFAPFENLGIIIIDEEHENSYKQDDTPRYHARDIAIFRGEYHQCPVILGSATPTLETFARAKKGVYQLLTLSKRMNNQSMPEVEIVDMRKELHQGNRSMFSFPLQERIRDRLQKHEQIVLLLNRRGYSTFVMCRDCGTTMQCPHCDISLTYHRKQERLKCHYCSYEIPMPQTCPECGSESIRYFGTGTQKVEESLQQTFPEARIIRMDVDTTRRKGAHEKLLNQFREGKADILLGTQMIAKGLDFNNVTLVGVLAADSMLYIPDFRSSEKTFQLLTQVSGRAGRHELPGEVVVQTYTPDHYSIEMASQYQYDDFFQYEMRMRKRFQYPPYYFLALVTVSHPNNAYVVQVTQKIVKSLNHMSMNRTQILGPTPSPITRIKNRYRYQCMIKYKNEPNLYENMKSIIQQYEKEIQSKDLQISIDFQPTQMM